MNRIKYGCVLVFRAIMYITSVCERLNGAVRIGIFFLLGKYMQGLCKLWMQGIWSCF